MGENKYIMSLTDTETNMAACIVFNKNATAEEVQKRYEIAWKSLLEINKNP